jgi:molybdate transport system permease protein
MEYMFVWNALYLSLKIAGCAVLINTVLGIGLGFLFARATFFGKTCLDIIFTLPMVMPPTVLGYYLLVLLGQKSMFGRWLSDVWGIQLVFTWQGAVIAAVLVTFPLVFKPARAAFETVDSQLEDAANILGASALSTFLRVSLPLAFRSIFAGILLSFARGLGEFGATLMVAGSIEGETQTLSIAIYELVQAGDDAQLLILVLVTTTLCATILLLATWLSPKSIWQK